MNLHEYGIAQENSHIRAHVSLPGRRITVYRTSDMLRLISERQYQQKLGYQPNVSRATANGYVVPIGHVQPQYVLSSSRFKWDAWDHESMGCKEKGDMAVACVSAAIRANKFPLWVCGVVVSEKEIDIQGTDIVVSAKRRIQVKYDFGAYPIEEGGTGNLYIQTHECNPLKIH